ncbi:transcriptional regulator [Nocardia farcinica]|uniref:transcriptional regulator n=1 Tax=Nocardia farcinica TaxID=37329 RepID=UPI00245585E0|nr:transcriptional regulator [Nocardia farcinica]
MITNLGLPPNAIGTRETVQRRLSELSNQPGVTETLTVEWRGTPHTIQVIDMPLADLLYNPNTHRIRAQRSLDPERDATLRAEPWTAESQDYLHHLLTVRPSEPDHRDPEFEELKKSLAEHRQLEPGLITHEGILVNGNTRCAALRELGTTSSIRVGVLPQSCTWDDINDVELTLQLRPDRRRTYSYINRLLAIEEQRLVLNRELPAIAKAFHTDVKSCERDLWILAQLKDLVDRSATKGGNRLRLMDLERSQEKLAELYRAYVKEARKSHDRAELLKEARLAAIVLDFSKTDVRYVEADFNRQYLRKNLPERYVPAGDEVGPGGVAIPGLNRTVQADGTDVRQARAITDTLLKAKAVEVAKEAAEPAEYSDAIKVIVEYKEAFEQAIDTAGRTARLRKKRLAAPDRVNDACKDLEQAVTDLVVSRGSASLDEPAFDDALTELRTVLKKLAIEAERSIDDAPGKGLQWLIEAVNMEMAGL